MVHIGHGIFVPNNTHVVFIRVCVIERSGCLQWFGGPDKEMHSISRANKLWVECAVGVRHSGMI
jgi:hypothetical protein